MKAAAIACARNEADIIEAFVRHTAAYCDQLIIVDHGSADETPDILRSLKSEGIPLHIISDSRIGNLQTEHMNQMLKMAANDFAADWIICLDADEFLQGPLKAAFTSEAQDQSGSPRCLRVRLRNYYAHPNDNRNITNPVVRLAHYDALEPSGSNYKVIVPGALARDEKGILEQGNHQFWVNGFEAGYRKLDDVWLGHFSIRSPSQYASKLVSKTLQKYRLVAEKTHNEDFYEKPYREMRDSYSGFAANFHNVRLSWAQSDGRNEKLVHNPIEYLGGPLCYTPERLDTDQFVKQILDLTESLARTVPQTGETGDAKENVRSISISISESFNSKPCVVQNFEADQSKLTTLVFPLHEVSKNKWFHVGVSNGPGMLEISEVTLVYSHSPQIKEVFDTGALQRMLKIVATGVSIASSGFTRILMSQLPMHFLFENRESTRKEAPIEAIFKLRFASDCRLLASTILAPNVVGQFYSDQCLASSRPRRKWKDKWRKITGKKNAPENYYSLGENISFSNSGNGQRFATIGWSHPEPWGTWSQNPNASLVFQFSRPPVRDLVLRVFARMLTGQNHKEMQVHVSIGGRRLKTWTLNSSKFRLFDAAIPADLLGEKKLTVDFEMDKPISPAEAGLSSDQRQLGLGIRNACLTTPGNHQFRQILHYGIGTLSGRRNSRK